MAVYTGSGVRILLGTMTFGGQTSKADACLQISHYVSAMRAAGPSSVLPELDSAHVYCGGKTEELLGALIHEGSISLQNVSFSTKANVRVEPHKSLSATSITEQLNRSLKRLN